MEVQSATNNGLRISIHLFFFTVFLILFPSDSSISFSCFVSRFWLFQRRGCWLWEMSSCSSVTMKRKNQKEQKNKKKKKIKGKKRKSRQCICASFSASHGRMWTPHRGTSFIYLLKCQGRTIRMMSWNRLRRSLVEQTARRKPKPTDWTQIKSCGNRKISVLYPHVHAGIHTVKILNEVRKGCGNKVCVCACNETEQEWAKRHTHM